VRIGMGDEPLQLQLQHVAGLDQLGEFIIEQSTQSKIV
jgi:hypothetical protein